MATDQELGMDEWKRSHPFAGPVGYKQELARRAGLQNIAESSLSGPGQGLSLGGSKEAQQGAAQGLQFGQMLYGQGIGDVGKESAEYGQMVKGRLDTDSAKADLYRQGANRRIAQGANKLGMAGATLGGAQEQAYRQSGAEAAAMNQEYKDKALALYGRNISAKQQGLAGQYMAGAGIGQASTPSAIPQYSSGLSVICTELHIQKKISKKEWILAGSFGYSLDHNTYIGYLTIAKPIVELMKKSDKFSNLFIGWAKSIAKKEPNLLTRILLPICWMVGYVRQVEKKETTRIASR